MRNILISIFDGIKDPRKIDRCVYELGDFLAAAFLSYLSGDGKEEKQTRYYISDEDFPSAANYGALARGHWAVENGLHWHLDVIFRDDDCRARKDNAAQNLSLLRKLALQVAKATSDRLSLRKRLVRASRDKDYLRTLLKNSGF